MGGRSAGNFSLMPPRIAGVAGGDHVGGMVFPAFTARHQMFCRGLQHPRLVGRDSHVPSKPWHVLLPHRKAAIMTATLLVLETNSSDLLNFFHVRTLFDEWSKWYAPAESRSRRMGYCPRTKRLLSLHSPHADCYRISATQLFRGHGARLQVGAKINQTKAFAQPSSTRRAPTCATPRWAASSSWRWRSR